MSQTRCHRRFLEELRAQFRRRRHDPDQLARFLRASSPKVLLADVELVARPPLSDLERAFIAGQIEINLLIELEYARERDRAECVQTARIHGKNNAGTLPLAHGAVYELLVRYRRQGINILKLPLDGMEKAAALGIVARHLSDSGQAGAKRRVRKMNQMKKQRQ